MENEPIRIILDTNLWLSFLITKEYSKLDKLLYARKRKLVFSPELLNEFLEVAHRPKFKKYFSEPDLLRLLNSIDEFAEFIDVKSKVELCRDAKDNFLLSLALDSQAHYLITGDKDLLILKRYGSTEIITFSEFIKKNI